MIIRSQDKKSTTTDLNFRIYHDKHSCEYEISNNAIGVIAIYSTEEKAIKVLDMIQEAYLKYEKMGGGVLNQYSSVSPFAIIPPKVFQMPSDEQVRV